MAECSIKHVLSSMCLLWILLQIGCYNPTLPSPLKPENELRSILFIGNSHTYYNGGVDQEFINTARDPELSQELDHGLW